MTENLFPLPISTNPNFFPSRQLTYINLLENQKAHAFLYTH